MRTTHKVFYQNAGKMKSVESDSIDLVVTSPPYPMIEMWDGLFIKNSPGIKAAFKKNDGSTAFELMHQQLDSVWDEVVRVLKKGGFACINIGDAVRTINERFQLYPNHARILSAFHQRNMSPLPAVIWRKQTNAPNKFMGSGVLPAGAYVTLEHEYILIFRKGGKREFKTAEDRLHRQQSAIFWEERNHWFSDIWMDLKGTRQHLVNQSVRKRSAAFPFEVPYRLIHMYSTKGDTVLDPFLGIGTATFAAMAAGRNSIGFEIDKVFREIIDSQAGTIVDYANQRIQERLKNHEAFVKKRTQEKGPLKYFNTHHQFPVVMNQEKNLKLDFLHSIEKKGSAGFEVTYTDSLEIKPFYQMELKI